MEDREFARELSARLLRARKASELRMATAMAMEECGKTCEKCSGRWKCGIKYNYERAVKSSSYEHDALRMFLEDQAGTVFRKFSPEWKDVAPYIEERCTGDFAKYKLITDATRRLVKAAGGDPDKILRKLKEGAS